MKEELLLKTETLDSFYYQSIFISESPPEGDASTLNRENKPQIKVDRIDAASQSQVVKEETGRSEDKSDHEQRHISEDQCEDEFDEIEVEAAEANFICKDCKRPFTSKRGLVVHIKRGKGNCQSVKTRKGDYDCDICGKKIRWMESLKDHKIRFHNKGRAINKYKCDLCDFSSPVRRSVTCHIRTVHAIQNGKPLKCSLCDYSTPWKSKLSQHIMTVHQKIKEQVCKLCGFATSRKQNLTLHMRSVHLKVKPFQCTICGHATTQSNGLTDHIEIVHTKPPKRERKCYICNKLLGLKRLLKAHLKKEHSDKNCQKCDFKATDAFILNDHYEHMHST